MESYIPIKICDLSPFQTLDFDVYILLLSQNKYLKYIHRNDPIDNTMLLKLQGRGLHVLFVSSKELEAYKKFIAHSLSAKFKNPAYTSEQRIAMVKKEAIQLIENLETMSEGSDVSTWTQNCFEIIMEFIYQISTVDSMEKMFNDFTKNTEEGSPFIKHSMQTCALSVLLGTLLGIHEHKELTELAIAGLFHDLGLKNMTAAAQQKYFRGESLTVSEKLQIQKHPADGAEKIKSMFGNNIISQDVLKIINEHHVSTSVNAYPHNASLAELTYLTRIVAIADCLSRLVMQDGVFAFPLIVSKLILIQQRDLYHELDMKILNQIKTVATQQWEG
ncbi:MAG: HD domain-containing protein [Oligoflexia bacterium]|nr:HD domain-containing protein [Oligoflexia bacterium]